MTDPMQLRASCQSLAETLPLPLAKAPAPFFHSRIAQYRHALEGIEQCRDQLVRDLAADSGAHWFADLKGLCLALDAPLNGESLWRCAGCILAAPACASFPAQARQRSLENLAGLCRSTPGALSPRRIRGRPARLAAGAAGAGPRRERAEPRDPAGERIHRAQLPVEHLALGCGGPLFREQQLSERPFPQAAGDLLPEVYHRHAHGAGGKLLKSHPDMRVFEVAARTAFCRTNISSRFFKKYYGVSPAMYQKSQASHGEL